MTRLMLCQQFKETALADDGSCLPLWSHVSGQLERSMYHRGCGDSIYVPRRTASTLRLAVHTAEICSEPLLAAARNLKECFPSLARAHIPFVSAIAVPA